MPSHLEEARRVLKWRRASSKVIGRVLRVGRRSIPLIGFEIEKDSVMNFDWFSLEIHNIFHAYRVLLGLLNSVSISAIALGGTSASL